MDIGYIDKQLGKQWIDESRELSKMLFSLIQLARSKS
jgi:hypothetical protein